MNRYGLFLSAMFVVGGAFADEGMWTIDNFPAASVAEKYGVEISDEWLRAAQLATARLESGCTGSFASEEGLVLTNNHCVWSCVRNLSTDERNLSDEGFHASERDQELRCAGQQVSVLTGMEEVTDDIGRATAGLPDAEANKARKATLTKLEAACEKDAGGEFKCEAVTLYDGGQYFIYKYKRYEDVRLVFAPELAIAAFGGDPDNFNFPRWCLDMSFLRVYENGVPAKTPNFLAWRAAGPAAGDPVFITGHPGSTDRLLTLSQLRMLRDVEYPLWLLRYSELRGRMLVWQDTSAEAARAVQQRILGIENGLKVRRNQLKALQNDDMMAIKAEQEAALRATVNADPELRAQYGEAWTLIDKAMMAYRNFYEDYLFVELDGAFRSDLFDYAKTLVRAAEERELPNEKRIRDYTDAALPALEQSLVAARPINKDYEKLGLTFSLEKMREWLGPDSRYVHLVLGKRSPKALAAELIDGSKLDDPEYRRKLWKGGAKAIRASDDPMIRLALKVDADGRALRKRYEDEVEAPRQRGEEMIADARFQVYGTDTYPDATFTLRLTYGSVSGWEEKGSMLEPFTRTRRLYERATGEAPFALPAKWLDSEDKLNLATPFNFVATTDITGGNSGSPILAADGALVGLAFDGNIHSIAGAYWFDPSNNRTVGVDTAIILEALEKVYGAGQLVDELTVIE